VLLDMYEWAASYESHVASARLRAAGAAGVPASPLPGHPGRRHDRRRSQIAA
jgi:hypothetical protein